MAYCDVCGNFDDSHLLECGIESKEYEQREDYQPDLYYYWDSPIEEIYYWRDAFPKVDCMCEICLPTKKRKSFGQTIRTVYKVSHTFPI